MPRGDGTGPAGSGGGGAKVEAAGNPAAWGEPLRQDRQAPACARSAVKGSRINGESPALNGNARIAAPR